MNGRWLCENDDNLIGSPSKQYRFIYIPDSMAAVINWIEVNGSEGYLPSIEFAFSPAYYQELTVICDQLAIPYITRDETFTRFLDESDEHVILLHANFYTTRGMTLNEENLKKILTIFNHFNQTIDSHLFPKELIEELTYLSQLYSGVPTKSFITKKNRWAPCYHRTSSLNRPAYQSLADILSFNNNSRELKRYLVEGDNPNELQAYQDDHDGRGISPLTFALLRQSSNEPLELLLWYKADPFRRLKRLGYLTDYEVAIAYGQNEKALIISNEYAKANNQSLTIQQSRERLFVTGQDIKYFNNAVICGFQFNNNKIITTLLKSVTELKQEERNSVFTLFMTNFEIPGDINNVELRKEFEEDFCKTKLVDVIYDNNKIIGFNLFEIINESANEKFRFLHCVYAAIEPAYRGYGLMVLLTFRLAYVLEQMALNKEKIGIFFSSIHYNSYRMVHFGHYPKYQDQAMITIINRMIKKIYGSNCLHYHEFLMSFIMEELRVRQHNNVSREISLDERIYHREMRGLKNMVDSEGRAVPVAFLLNTENKKHMQKLAQGLGVNFNSHISHYANQFNLFAQSSAELSYLASCRPRL